MECRSINIRTTSSTSTYTKNVLLLVSTIIVIVVPTSSSFYNTSSPSCNMYVILVDIPYPLYGILVLVVLYFW